MRERFLRLSRLTLLVTLAVARGVSADFDFSGNFSRDDDAQSFFFTLTQSQTITLRTSSYANGGFDPTLSVFDSSGNLIAVNQDGGCDNVPKNPVTGFCWDAFLSLKLPAGTYRAVLTQSENTPNGPTISDSFVYAGQGNFTQGSGNAGSGGFQDAAGTRLSAAFGITTQSVSSAAAQLLVSQQSPPPGKAGTAYSYQLDVTGGTQPYTWTLAPDSSLPSGLSLSAAGLIAGTPTLAGSYNFTVQVSDASSPAMTATQPFQIQIAPRDLQITTTSLQTWVTGNGFTKTLEATGGYPPYTWSFAAASPTAAGLTISSDGVLTGTATAAGTYTIPAQITDAQHNVATQQIAWQVNPPVMITSAATLPPGITNQAYSGFTFTAQGGAAASDMWTVTSGTLPPGTSLSPSGVLQGTPTARASYSFTVQASDGVQPARQSVTMNVFDPVRITTQSLPAGTMGSGYGPVTLAAQGGSGSYVWASPNLPSGLSLSAAGQIGGSPGVAGNFMVTVHLADSTAAQTASANLAVSIGYQALQISSSGALGTVGSGSGVSKSFAATGGKPPYTWSAPGLPTGLTLDANSGTLSGTTGQPGTYPFTVQVTDSQPTSTSLNATLSVLGITTSSLANASTTAAYSQPLNAAGGTPPYSFSGTGLPQGMSISASGVLSGTPKTAGAYSISVRISDSTGVSVTKALSLTVTAPPNVSVSSSISNGTVGTPYSDTLGANGGLAPYTWSIIGGTLPDGLSASNSGTISGTPTKAGSFTFTARATDNSGGSASAAIAITIAPPALTLPAVSALPNGIVGSEYFAQVLAPSGGTPPYTFALTGGALPDGLALANGQISGTPTSANTYRFTLTASDSAMPPATAAARLSIAIRPAQADLLLSSGSLSFSLASGATGLPSAASIPVRSSVVQQLLNYTVAAIPSVSWLDVSGGGTTPGSISVALNSAALSLNPAATPYVANIAVTCISPSPCAGATQTISVSLNVAAPPPQLSVGSSLLSFSATTSNPQTDSQTFGLQNIGGGSIGIRSITAADSWVSVSGTPASITAGTATPVAVSVNPVGLTPGYYRSTISISTSAGSASVPVGFFYAKNDSMVLSPAGTQFSLPAGGTPGNPNGSFLVSVAGNTAVNWTASVAPGANWLVLASANGSSTGAAPGSVSFSIDAGAAAALAPGAYYGTIRVASGDVVNSPQDFEVVLNVVPATEPARPDPQPAGLVFISASGASSLPPQTVTVFASSTNSVLYQASAATSDGQTWLSVSPATGSTSASLPAESHISVNLADLPPGVYQGGVSYAFSSAAVRTVNVTLIVQPQPGTTPQVAAPRLISHAAPACTPTKLVPTQTGLVNNFAQPVAWPTPLSIQLFNDCGIAVPDGQVVATFSNGDPPLPLTMADRSSGIYSGTWTPRSASSQMTISARATKSGLPAATAQITGQVNPNNAPVLTPHGTLHVFDPLIGGALGPGNIVQIYGANLGGQTLAASTIPLPTSLGGTSVIIGGIQAPLYFASPGQINAQVPFELGAGKKYQVLVNANGALTTPDTIQLTDVSPGIAAFAGGQIIAQHLDASLITEAAPAKPGEIIVFYLAGLGQTDNPVATGAGTPLDRLSRPVDAPVLTLNGTSVPVLFAGLTPGLVGLYQVNFQVPNDAPDGDLQLVIVQNGAQSNTTILPVKK